MRAAAKRAAMERRSGPQGRSARQVKCRNCGAALLRGMDGDVAAFLAVVDAAPTTPLGEALALLSGRRTYDVRPAGNAWQLSKRDRWQVRGRPAGRRAGLRFDVHPEHRCGQPLPATDSMFLKAEKGTPDDKPPF